MIDVTSRQRAYVERYIKDVLLKLDGAPGRSRTRTASALEMTANALLHGGKVPSPQGSLDDLVPVPPPASAAIRVKLAHERDAHPPARRRRQHAAARRAGRARRSRRRCSSCGSPARSSRASPATPPAKRRGSRTSSLGRPRARRDRARAARRARRGRHGPAAVAARPSKQSARFRSLVHNSLDLITVVDEHSIALYQSPSSTAVLGYAPADVVGTQAHRPAAPERQGARRSRRSPTSTTGRARPSALDVPAASPQRHVGDDGRHRAQPRRRRTVGGFVVNTRDVTERERVDGRARRPRATRRSRRRG